MYDIPRIIVEIVSAVICFILVRFMIKPYRVTGENRYVGLPFAFGLLGVSYLISAFVYARLSFIPKEILWFQLVVRTFAFVFLATTYYFSKKPSKNSRLLWDLTLSLIIIAVIVLFIIGITAPQFAIEGYQACQFYVRIFNIICLSYISIHTLKSHTEKSNPTTIWIPFGYIFLGISQYSLIFWAIDSSLSAFMGALVLRLMGLTVFLFVSLRTFYSQKRENE